MLTLSNLATRIEALEQEEYLSVNERLNVWRNMVAWQYWLNSLPSPDNWRVYFNELPLNHPVRDLAGKLTWLEVQLSPVLTAKRDGFWGERVYIALEALFTDMIDSGYSQEQVSSLEVMNEGIAIVNTLLDNDELWQGFYEGKRQENEHHELRQKYRRMAHEGSILPEGIKWLEEYDAAFLENFTAKKQSEVKPVTSETVKKLESNQLVTLPEAPKPIEIIQPVTDGPVTVKYLGGWRGFQVTTTSGMRSIEPGDEVLLPPFVWENIQNGVMPKSWWIRL